MHDGPRWSHEPFIFEIAKDRNMTLLNHIVYDYTDHLSKTLEDQHQYKRYADFYKSLPARNELLSLFGEETELERRYMRAYSCPLAKIDHVKSSEESASILCEYNMRFEERKITNLFEARRRLFLYEWADAISSNTLNQFVKIYWSRVHQHLKTMLSMIHDQCRLAEHSIKLGVKISSHL